MDKFPISSSILQKLYGAKNTSTWDEQNSEHMPHFYCHFTGMLNFYCCNQNVPPVGAFSALIVLRRRSLRSHSQSARVIRERKGPLFTQRARPSLAAQYGAHTTHRPKSVASRCSGFMFLLRLDVVRVLNKWRSGDEYIHAVCAGKDGVIWLPL